jgi:hypothetical protein
LGKLRVAIIVGAAVGALGTFLILVTGIVIHELVGMSRLDGMLVAGAALSVIALAFVVRRKPEPVAQSFTAGFAAAPPTGTLAESRGSFPESNLGSTASTKRW